MLLTLKPPGHSDFRSPPDYPSLNATGSRYSPPATVGSGHSDTFDARMSQPHRGLPPPAAMTLPPASSSLPAMSGLGQLPAPPSQWSGAEESMRNWLHAKAEEDKRKQEEERTKQEEMRLDQRRIEQTMLRESLQGGIPPVMVPLIFAGMGGANLTNQSLEWAQHYMAQMSLQQNQAQQQQQQQQIQVQQPQQLQQAPPPPPPPPPGPSEDIRRDSRMVAPSTFPNHQQIQPAITPSAPSQQMQSQPSQSAVPRQSQGLRTSGSSGNLSRLNTNEMQIQGPPTSQQPAPFSSNQSASNAQSESQQNLSSTALYFHHWKPPSNNSSQNPPTPSGKSQQSSPFAQNAPSHLRADYQNSPKKRKATGGHQAAPAPTQSDASPQFSQASSRDRDSPPGRQGGQRRHSRQGSNGSSTRGYEGHQAIPRPSSRQLQHDHHQQQTREINDDRTGKPMGGPLSNPSVDDARRRVMEPETRQSRYAAGPDMRD